METVRKKNKQGLMIVMVYSIRWEPIEAINSGRIGPLILLAE
jgi:hypothetical protein